MTVKLKISIISGKVYLPAVKIHFLIEHLILPAIEILLPGTPLFFASNYFLEHLIRHIVNSRNASA